MRAWSHFFRVAAAMLLLAMATLAAAGCSQRPTGLSGPARKACEDHLSQRLGGFPGFPSEDPRNESTPVQLTDDRSPAYRMRGVVAADGIRGIYDCEVMSPDSGRSWKVLDLKFNLIPREAE